MAKTEVISVQNVEGIFPLEIMGNIGISEPIIPEHNLFPQNGKEKKKDRKCQWSLVENSEAKSTSGQHNLGSETELFFDRFGGKVIRHSYET